MRAVASPSHRTYGIGIGTDVHQPSENVAAPVAEDPSVDVSR